MKLTVPSIGSMIQVTPLADGLLLPSSPRIPSSGRRCASVSTMASSASVSTIVTGSTALDFVCVNSRMSWSVVSSERLARMMAAVSATRLTARSRRAAG